MNERQDLIVTWPRGVAPERLAVCLADCVLADPSEYPEAQSTAVLCALEIHRRHEGARSWPIHALTAASRRYRRRARAR